MPQPPIGMDLENLSQRPWAINHASRLAEHRKRYARAPHRRDWRSIEGSPSIGLISSWGCGGGRTFVSRKRDQVLVQLKVRP